MTRTPAEWRPVLSDLRRVIRSNLFRLKNTFLSQNAAMIGLSNEMEGVFIMENQYSYYDQGNEHTNYHQENTGRNQADGQTPKHRRRIPKVVATIGCAVLFGAVAGVTFLSVSAVGGNILGFAWGTQGEDSVASLNQTALSTSTGTVTSDISGIVENAMPSVVSITNMSVQQVQNFFGQTGTMEQESSGSGIIIAQNDTELLIVTNNHVVEGSNTLTVTFNDGTSLEASIKGTDAATDLAVIAVPLDSVSEETMDSIAIATLGDSTTLKVGEPAIAIGNALGYGQSVTTGIISATGRQLTAGEDGDQSIGLIQTDAAINPGNSGGALLNANGQVIGINSAKLAANEVEGMGYAIPISDVSDIITELMNQETKTKVDESEKGYLGIQGLDVTDETTQRFNMPAGVYVSETIEGSGAEAAGIKKGSIITDLNGTAIDSMETLQNELGYYKAGEKVDVTVQVPSETGEYNEKTVEVILGTQPES